jgi:FkbM family methyltransferase
MRDTFRFLWTHPLLAGRPLYALWRFLGWQLRSRLWPRPVVFAWIGASRLWLRRGWGGLTGNYYAGLYDFEDMGFLLHFLRPGDLFADVGANMGSYTVLAGAVCRARSVSYEPVPSSFERLIANRELNGLGALADCRPRAVGAVAGSVAMTSSYDAMNHVVASGGSAGLTVPVVTLDEDLAEVPSLMKIDVEGFESEVLRGARRHLADPRLQAIIIELNGAGRRYGKTDADIHAHLLAAGFGAYRYSPRGRTLTPLAAPGHANTLYCRDRAFVEARLRSAEPFTAAHRSF